ncbi:MAG: YjbQ family protein [Candidatus Omnitrophica bacterium]|nr:YjbQ family protein [Candidatus Omnitrophota bacterium]
MKQLTLSTASRNEYVDITAQVRAAVKEAHIEEGLCVIYCPHTTAAITVNENADPSVFRDIREHLGALVPEGKNYAHAEGNADAHIKSALFGCAQPVPVTKGALALGTWQGIFFCEFDGPRKRNVYVQCIKQ